MKNDEDKAPSIDDAERCVAIRKRSKTGYYNKEDSAFCRKMFDKYPNWYQKTEARVFNETVPFGSQARYGGEDDD